MQKSIELQQGFTLIEGIMVIILITILSAVVTSIFNGQKIFIERFFTDDVTQMIHYARKVAMATECEVEIVNEKSLIKLLQREKCQRGNFTRRLPAPSLLDNGKPFEIEIPHSIAFSGKFPLYVNSRGKIFEQSNQELEKITWRINKRMLSIDPFSGFIYESH